jgi:hypothetical protein
MKPETAAIVAQTVQFAPLIHSNIDRNVANAVFRNPLQLLNNPTAQTGQFALRSPQFLTLLETSVHASENRLSSLLGEFANSILGAERTPPFLLGQSEPSTISG